jgi:transposase
VSTQILYHAFGVTGYRHVSFHNEDGDLVWVIERPRHKLRCPLCNSNRVHKVGTSSVRDLQTLPVGPKHVFLRVTIAKLFCPCCMAIHAECCLLVDGKRHYTRALERFAVMLCRMMTIKDVANHLGLTWDTVKAMEKRYLKRRFDPPLIRDVQRIAIDEIAVRKGHVYKTVVLDLDSGHILHVGDGKGAEAVEPFFRRLRRARVMLKAIAMDMSNSYLSAVKQWAPGTPVVFDRFHVMQLVNGQIDDLRRAHMRDTDMAERKFVKGVRYLLLMSPDTLDRHEDGHPGSKARLKAALALNEPLNKAYYLKEKIRCLWDEPTRIRGERVLRECIAEAASSGVRELVKLGKTLLIHAEGILAYFDHRISSGPLEGTNNKIKVLKRNAYGYRDDEFFRLKLLGLHESRCEIIG